MKPNPRVKETSQRALLQRGVLCRRVLSALFLFLSAFLGFPGRRAEARLLLSGASPDRPPLRHFTKPAFLSPGEGAASHAPFPSARSSRCSTAACSLASFFRRRRGSKKTPQDEGSVPQEEPYPQTFDALRFLGLASEEGAPPLSSAALKARLSVLEAKRRALESLGGPPLLPLASELIQESVAAVSEALNRGQQQALDAVSSPALAALLPRLSELEAKPPNSLAAKRDGDDEASESGGCEDSSNGEFDEEADDDEEPPDLLSALLSGSPFHPSRARGRRGGFFGSGFFGRQGKAARGEHAEAEVEVGFREAALGGRPREVRFSRKDPCSACEGSGVKGGKGSAAASCESCKGKGVITKTQKTKFGIVSASTTCRVCGGAGGPSLPPCQECDGSAIAEREASVMVSLPPGVESGSLLKVRGQGHSPEGGGRRGDLLVRVFVRSDEELERKKGTADVLSSATLSLAEAVYGCEKVALPDRLSPEDRQLLQRLNEAQPNRSDASI